ncbi:helix-turn-helix transcriptional regulator [Paenibacillus sp. HN-1]|uniref:helix-turn-helix domain-containing protein n=1 Tax=Paenibacillus TaxID=44249 RepID=UPI001CA979F4|nr:MULTISPECIES: helix-turn-helix transcriptional regulator [Paenibacillus]MBY9077158.1 helix-turn-helix transcriptional regulator [Paenibacillus sp. CGMCC 1.18879]MBY9084446.1 helix-turn-helix transcriptional regulator [Paenibacillus sinensis]
MYEIFEKLLAQHGITAYRVAKDTGITTATFTSWKQGKYTPKREKLQKVADYFGVTLAYLMGESEGNGENEEKPYYALSDKDERDIAIDLERMMNELNSDSSIAFMGEPMDEEDRELLRISLENALRLSKEMAKKKFTPKKYRN